MNELETLAWKVAIHAPENQNQHAYAAKIPWTLIHELRDELEHRGYDWRSGTRAERIRLEEAGKRVEARRYAEQQARNKEGDAEAQRRADERQAELRAKLGRGDKEQA